MRRGVVAVTGVTGFVGRRLAARMLGEGHRIRGLVRREVGLPGPTMETMAVGDIDGATDWSTALAGVDVVIHLAARTHAVDEGDGGELGPYRRVNVEGTRSLAHAAARSGVGRIIYVSSIKVNGERTPNGRFMHGDPPAPEDAYGISKWEAEQVLTGVAEEAGFDVVVIRPPLVYGPGARGNFARLCRIMERGVVLPLGAVDNRRSLIALDNLVDVIVRCVAHPAAPGQTFLVSDGEDLSTPELIRRLAQAMGKEARLLPVPPWLLRLGGSLTGRGPEMRRLLHSLQVDIGHTRETLDWSPPVTVDEGLKRAVSSG